MASYMHKRSTVLAFAFIVLREVALAGRPGSRHGGFQNRYPHQHQQQQQQQQRDADPHHVEEHLERELHTGLHGDNSLFNTEAASTGPRLFLGPDFLSVKDPAAAEADMFSHADEWPAAIAAITNTRVGGGYHFHDRLLTALSAEQAGVVVKLLRQRNITVSIEAGGYLCDGEQVAGHTVDRLSNYTSQGGRIDYWALESIFSRTIHGCAGHFTSFEAVASQAVGYIQVIRKAFPNVHIGLIDAVPHFTAGKYGSNSTKPLGDLRDALEQLKAHLTAAGVQLEFYWADCPYEYSMAMPGNEGYEKLAFIANFTTGQLGIRMGKIFNSEQGGKTSNQMFYVRTLDDHARYMQTVPGGGTHDIIVESWYPHPDINIPETTQYSFTYTAEKIFAQHIPTADNHY